jgi:hypothetical protein
MSQLDDIIKLTEKKLSSSNTFKTLNFDFKKLSNPSGNLFPDGFDIGYFSNENSEIPAYLPLDAKNGVGFNIGNPADFTYFNEVLETSIFKVISDFTYSDFKITLIDGKNKGINFNNLIKLDDSINENYIYETQQDIENILGKLLETEEKHIRIIAINNFPNGFTTESTVSLLKLLKKRSHLNNTKIFITKELEPSRNLSDLDASLNENLSIMSIDKDNHWDFTSFSNILNFKKVFKLTFSHSQTEQEIKSKIALLNLMAQSLKIKEEVSFDIDNGIKIPIGKYNNKNTYFSLGHETTNYHGIIGGRSGKGKTVLLDNIITNGANIYNPDELRFVLLDLKGIEFNEYKNIPHIQAYCSSSDIENGLKIVEYLETELKSREKKFKKVGASNIVEYKEKTNLTLPRLLIVIDEFQNLFTGNYKTDAIVENILIKQILRLGRAYGVHLLCCTQSMGDGVRSSFLNNIPLRIAFQMTQDQSRSFLSMENKEAEKLKVGEAIYNEQDGILSENKHIKIEYLQNADIHKLLVEIAEKGTNYELFENLIIEDE